MALIQPAAPIAFNISYQRAFFTVPNDSGTVKYKLEARTPVGGNGNTISWTVVYGADFLEPAETVVWEEITPNTTYETRWKAYNIDASEVVTGSTGYFRTGFLPRYVLRPAIPAFLSGGAFTSALQEELDEHINYINTLDEERAIERLIKEGVGRFQDQGCRLSVSPSGGLRMSNGWYHAGSGLENIETEYFMGARMVKVSGTLGYVDLDFPTGAAYPKVITVVDDEEIITGGIYGYMSAFSQQNTAWEDIEWETELITPRPNDRWLIGRVFTNGVNVTEVDDSVADVIYTIKYLKELIEDLEVGGGGGTGTVPDSLSDINLEEGGSEDALTGVIRLIAEKSAEDREYADNLVNKTDVYEMFTPADTECNNSARAAIGLGERNPNALLRLEGAYILKDIYGDGTNGTPDFEGPGSLPYDPITRSFTPM